MKERHDRPFFAAVGLTKTHIGWSTPRKDFDMYPLDKLQMPAILENDTDDIPEGHEAAGLQVGRDRLTREAGLEKKIVQSYLAGITCTDTAIGRIIEAVDTSRYADNTIVVLWSDHGHHAGKSNGGASPRCGRNRHTSPSSWQVRVCPPGSGQPVPWTLCAYIRRLPACAASKRRPSWKAAT